MLSSKRMTNGCRSSELREVDLDVLSPLIAGIEARRAKVLRRWRDLYVEHFGDQRSLPDPDFYTVMGLGLDALKPLAHRDVTAFREKATEHFRDLATHGARFSETMVLARLFEEGAAAILDDLVSPGAGTYLSLHEFVGWCIPVIAEVYFGLGPADMGGGTSVPPRPHAGSFHGLVGASEAMQRLYEQIAAVARTRCTVLVTGETGTGKELVARAIHELSASPEAPFVALNCSALPADLIESELFGHVRGAFSGADTAALGLFRAADGGTLFLDEITEMSISAQARLLRALQERRVRPIGSTSELAVDVRVIASTNRDPQEAVACGHLRGDLYYRLQVATLDVAPLRERQDDLPLLLEHFIALFNERLERDVPVQSVNDRAMRAMLGYGWPGNVRELSNAVESALTFGSNDTILLDDLPPSISGRSRDDVGLEQRMMSLAEAESELLWNTLEATGRNLSKSARLLGISRKKLYARIAKYHPSYMTQSD